MALFGLGKKKEEKNTSCCSCQESIIAEPIKECCGNDIKGICCVKVLGAGCKSCHEQYENAKIAVNNLGLSVQVEYITDMAKIMEYGAMSMPAIVVNEKVASMGKVLKITEVEKLLQRYEV